MSDKINIDTVVPPESARDKAHARRKDMLVTWLAVLIVAATALTSIAALIMRELWFDPEAIYDQWPKEMLRLSLVAALSFVMGASQNNGPS